MLKMALLDCAINEKCCSVDGGRGICPLFSSPSRAIWQLKSPHSREFAMRGKKKMLMPGGQPEGGTGRRWNWLMHLTCCFLIFSLRCAKLVGSVAMQNISWYGNDFAWKIDNLMQRATKWTFMVPGPAEQQLAALIGWGGVYLNQNNSLWTFNNIHWWFNSVGER